MNARWGAYAPLPFVGTTTLLLVLILLTPTLISIGEPAPGLLTQAYLEVDRVQGSNVTHFYVRPEGATVRYAQVWVGLDENRTNIAWTGGGSPDWAGLNFSQFWNATDVVLLGFNSTANPVAVNVAACYESGSGNEFYQGDFAFYAGTSSGVATLFAASSDVTVPSSTPIDNASLPYLITLPATSTTCTVP